MQAYFDDIARVCLPLIENRKPIYAMVDFTGFVPQDRTTAEAIREHLLLCVKFGLQRIAILNATPLTAMQYKRVSKGVDVGFFEDRVQAIAWLREE